MHYSPNIHKAHFIQAWLDGGVDASCEKVYSFLKQIKLNAADRSMHTVSSEANKLPASPIETATGVRFVISAQICLCTLLGLMHSC